MKDAYGGIVNLVFISLFLLILSGIFGLIVSYTKAFKMKNNIISVIERYEGSGCICGSTFSGNDSCTDATSYVCRSKIVAGAKNLAYSPPSNFTCPKGYDKVDNLYCLKRKTTTAGDGTPRYVYSVVTQVDIEFPLVSDIFGFNVFKVTGETQEIEAPQ